MLVAVVVTGVLLAGIFKAILTSPDISTEPVETTKAVTSQKLLEKVTGTMSVPLVMEVYENGKKTGVWYQKGQDFRFDSPEGYSILYIAGKKSFFYIDHRQKTARQVFRKEIEGRYVSPFDMIKPYYEFRWIEVSPDEWRSSAEHETVSIHFDGPGGAISRIELSGETTLIIEFRYLKYGEYDEGDFYVPGDYLLTGPEGEGQ